MNVTEKYGKTNTVASICKAHGVPLEHGFIVADAVIHDRYDRTFWLADSEDYLGETLRPQQRMDDFINDLVAVRDWMRDQWAQVK